MNIPIVVLLTAFGFVVFVPSPSLSFINPQKNDNVFRTRKQHQPSSRCFVTTTIAKENASTSEEELPTNMNQVLEFEHTSLEDTTTTTTQQQHSLAKGGSNNATSSTADDGEDEEDDNNSPIIVTSHFVSLENRTRQLLNNNATHRGTWTKELFQEAQKAMELWSERQNKRSAMTVEKILRRVAEEQMCGNNPHDHHPGFDLSQMYTTAIIAWSNSRENKNGGAAAQRAEEILDTMQQLYEEGDEELQPTIRAFNAVLDAYSKSSQLDAPQQALRVLEKLYDWHSAGRTNVQPNTESYAAILRAYAKRGTLQSVTLVRELILHMEDLSTKQGGYPAVKPDYTIHNAYIMALVDAMNRQNMRGKEAAQRAEEYLQQMLFDPDEHVRPDTWTFNMVLAAWSRSGALEMVEHAEALVEQLEHYHVLSGRSPKTQPNTNTYNCLIACYSRSAMKDKAQCADKILLKMKKLANSGINPSAHPDNVTYNSVMNAYAKSRLRYAPYKVEEMLCEMNDLYEATGDRKIRPNSRSFNTCVDAWAKSRLPGSAERIMDWINHMRTNVQNGQSNILPNKWTYNAYLQALAKTGDGPTMGDEAEAVLKEMVELYENGWNCLKPDVLTFTNVIHCIALSGQPNALERSLSIVTRMEDLHSEGYGDVRPNTYTYNCVINAAAKSKRPGKAQIAVEILRRMQSVAIRPITVTYNNVLNACAFASPIDDEDPEEILQIALDILKEAQETCGANYITYGTVLRVIGSFERYPQKRWQRTQEIFSQCCRDGQLTKLVLTQVRYTLPPDKYKQVVKEAIDERTGEIREELKMNARKARMAPSTKKVINC